MAGSSSASCTMPGLLLVGREAEVRQVVRSLADGAKRRQRPTPATARRAASPSGSRGPGHAECHAHEGQLRVGTPK